MNQDNLFVTGLLSSIGLFILFYVIILLFVSIWQVFKKSGKPGWASIIPIYNLLIWVDIAEKPRIWLLLLLIPIVNFIPVILINISIAKKFGKSPAFGGIGLTFLSFIFYPILASKKSKYMEAVDREPDKSKIHTLGLLLATFVIFVFVSYPIQIISGLYFNLTMPESAKPFLDIPLWSIWVNMAGTVLFVMISIFIWNLKKLGVISFIGLSVILFIFQIAIGQPILLALLIFIHPLVLFLLVRNNWEVLE